jgi:hypothetical protein
MSMPTTSLSAPADRAGPRRLTLLAALFAACLWATAAVAQGTASPSWAELTATERLALHPLQSHWNSIDSVRKQKWREIAGRLPAMPRDQQIRMQARMAEWAGMTAAQRSAARLHFETTRQVPGTERQALWEAYQALPEAQRKALATRAVQRKTTPPTAAASASAMAVSRKVDIERIQPKSNVNAKPSEVSPRTIGPGTVQASVGASTRPITQRPLPPRHQQVGMPKIAATPGFVNRDTLLPQRGPQGAAAEPLTGTQ